MRIPERYFYLIVGLTLFLSVQTAEAQEICYGYDLLGRLVAVVDQQGRTGHSIPPARPPRAQRK